MSHDVTAIFGAYVTGSAYAGNILGVSTTKKENLTPLNYRTTYGTDIVIMTLNG